MKLSKLITLLAAGLTLQACAPSEATSSTTSTTVLSQGTVVTLPTESTPQTAPPQTTVTPETTEATTAPSGPTTTIESDYPVNNTAAPLPLQVGTPRITLDPSPSSQQIWAEQAIGVSVYVNQDMLILLQKTAKAFILNEAYPVPPTVTPVPFSETAPTAPVTFGKVGLTRNVEGTYDMFVNVVAGPVTYRVTINVATDPDNPMLESISYTSYPTPVVTGEGSGD